MQLTHTFWTLSTCLLYLVHLNAAKPVTTDQALSKKLFPPQFTYSKGFSTASGVSVSGVSSASLSDSALGVQDASSSTTHNIVTVGNKTTWEAIYPKGSWNPSNNPKGTFPSVNECANSNIIIRRWFLFIRKRAERFQCRCAQWSQGSNVFVLCPVS